jgi:TPR repeat protein
MEGKGCAANQVTAYYWFDDAARNTDLHGYNLELFSSWSSSTWRAANVKLAEFYVSGRAFPPDYAVALTIMLVVQNKMYVPKDNNFISCLKEKMTGDRYRMLNKP